MSQDFDHESFRATDKGYFMVQFDTSMIAITNIMFSDAMKQLSLDNAEDSQHISVDKFPNGDTGGVMMVAYNSNDEKLFSIQEIPEKMLVKSYIYG